MSEPSARRTNVDGITVAIEVRLFNSLARFGRRNGDRLTLTLPAGSTIGDVLATLAIPASEVHLALRNGSDVTPSLHTGVNTERAVDDGDVVALSGPVPYSWGYGAPVL